MRTIYHKDGSKTMILTQYEDPGKYEDPEHRVNLIQEGDHRDLLVRKARLRSPEMSGLNVDDSELSYHGDPIKTIAEQADGDQIEQTFARFDRDTGKYVGEYTARWEKTDQGQLTHTSTRRRFF